MKLSIIFGSILSYLFLGTNLALASGGYDVRGLKLNMSPDQAQSVITNLDKDVEIFPRREFFKGLDKRQIEETVHLVNTTYAFPRSPEKIEKISLSYARKPLDASVLTVFRSVSYRNKDRFIEPFSNSLEKKYGKASYVDKNNSRWLFLWTADGVPKHCSKLMGMGNYDGQLRRDPNVYYSASEPEFIKWGDCGEVLFVRLNYNFVDGDPNKKYVQTFTQSLFNPGKMIEEYETYNSHWPKWLDNYFTKQAESAPSPEL